MYAPEIDDLMDFNTDPEFEIDNRISRKLMVIYHSMEPVKIIGDDDHRMIWIEVPRGTIDDFGSFEEYRNDGSVETREEFNQLWLDYYPHETKWYAFDTAIYKKQRFFYFASKLIFTHDESVEYTDSIGSFQPDVNPFLDWLLNTVNKVVGDLRENARAYNNYVAQNLSYNKRIGRILRKDLWEILGENAMRLDKNLGEEIISTFSDYIRQSKKNTYKPTLPRMTANDFYNYCTICYDANDYFDKAGKDLSPKEKYLRMADGRDAGLRDIDPGSEEAFRKWYNSGERMGANPWEICRGGNSTHISLFVSPLEDGWQMSLAGSSVVRVEETVRMAVALFNKNIPFTLRDDEEVLRMITGSDFIGIVPDHITPRYCWSLFPEEDRIIDFMNLGWDRTAEIIEKAFWYPLQKIELQTK